MRLPFPHPDLETLAKRLSASKEAVGMAVFGSWARGTQRPDSDMDILVLTKKGLRREIERIGKTTFEFVFVSYAGARAFYQENPDNAVRMWKEAKIVFDKTGSLKRLKAYAHGIEKRGKKPLPKERRAHAAFDATDALRAIQGLAKKDRASANLYAQIQGIHLLELAYDLKGEWKPAPKQQLSVLAKQDPRLAKTFTEFFTAWSLRARIRALARIHQRLF